MAIHPIHWVVFANSPIPASYSSYDEFESAYTTKCKVVMAWISVDALQVQHDIANLELGNEESGDGDDSLLNQTNSLSTQNDQNAKLLFCHQTPHQQRMLRRYNSQVISSEF